MPETYGAHECKAFFVVESVYGQTPTNPSMIGIQAESVEPALDPSLIKVRGIGSRDLTALKIGLRKPTLKITHILPYEVPIHFIQHASTLNSLSVQVLYYKGSFGSPTDVISLLYKGCRIDKLTLEGGIDDVVKATVELVAQDVTVGTSKISGAVYSEYSGCLNSNNVVIQKGNMSGGSLTTVERITDWKVSIENNLKPVPVVRGTSSHLLKYLQPRHRDLLGELTFEFEDKTEWDEIVAVSEFSWKFNLTAGSSNYLLFTYCQWNEIKTPTKIEDLVSLKARFTARSVSIG